MIGPLNRSRTNVTNEYHVIHVILNASKCDLLLSDCHRCFNRVSELRTSRIVVLGLLLRRAAT